MNLRQIVGPKMGSKQINFVFETKLLNSLDSIEFYLNIQIPQLKNKLRIALTISKTAICSTTVN